jgi:glycosyltransferase involved in cell wall biosynthesis
MNPLRKGTDLLLKATAKLSGNFKLIIHSQLDLFSYYNENIDILDCIKTLKESGKLTIITKSVSAPGLYNLGNVYVYPCRLDGLGLTVPEALSSGLPTIVPNAEPMKDFISPSCSLIAIDRFYCRKDGYYWPQQLCDIDDLKHKMENYITDDQLEEKMSVARSHALENLDWQKNSAELNIFIASTKVLPIDSITADTYDKYKHYGYRKIITTIERLSFIFSPIYTIYHKLKKR